jgi:hypothetical protein
VLQRCTTFCEYFRGDSPGEIIKNEQLVASDSCAMRFLPMDFLRRQPDGFLFPTDPRLREKEQQRYLIAHYVDAAVKLSEGDTDISANDVNAFMLEIAKEISSLYACAA